MMMSVCWMTKVRKEQGKTRQKARMNYMVM